MPNTPQGQWEILRTVLLFAGSILFGGFGGGVKHLSDTLSTGAVKRVLISQALIGAFSGALSALYFYDRGSSYAFILGMSGLAGFGGYVLLNNALRLFYRYFPDSPHAFDKPPRGHDDDHQN